MQDSVDRIVAEWGVERPDLPVGPVEVLTRLNRLRTRIDDELAAVFARYDLSAADFTVIAALRRAGTPYMLPQSVLMARLGLTSGTVSVRLGRLEGKGVVTRAPRCDATSQYGYALAAGTGAEVVRPAWFDAGFMGFYPLACAALFLECAHQAPLLED